MQEKKNKMPVSMQHWNGNILCAIDTETTGLDPCWHEMIQLAILPLDANIKIRTDVLPFNIYLKPECPERADKKAMSVNNLDFCRIGQIGFDREAAKDMLIKWKDNLGLPYNKYGNPCKIIPLGHNYAFDCGFIKKWLGWELYDSIFHYHYKDTMHTVLYLNDHRAMHGELVEFPKVSLSYVANILQIDVNRAHDALSDARVSAEIYRILISRGLLA